jgi:hypothetical protein
MVYLYDACDQISEFCHQQLLRKMRRKISWMDGRTEVKQYTPLPLRGADYRDLIFGHKLHIGSPYRGKRFLTRQIPTSCLPKSGGIISEPNIRILPSTATEKNATKNILDGRKDRGKTVYPPPSSGSGGIIN